jgi:hypothetical protein
MKRCAVLLIAVLGVVGVSPRASAWEFDLHYLLTFWIATQVGFSRADATEIAAADQGYDDSAYHSAIGIMCLVGIWGDVGAASTLQNNHFPSDARLPSPPARRIVTPNSKSARIAIDAALPRSDAKALEALGQALHPLQDSWSHQGIPDVPFGFRPDLSCAHPAARGGWRSHNADLTHLHVAEVIDVAHETCAVLASYLRLHPDRRDRTVKAATCESLDARALNDFARAGTKPEKDQWAQAHTGEARFSAPVAMLTLPGSTFKSGSLRILPPPPARAGQPPPELLTAAQDFLAAWATQANIDRAVTSVNWNALSQQFPSDSPLLNNQAGVIQWCRKFMTMYLVVDHARVDRAGHGDPASKDYASLPESAGADRGSWPVQALPLERPLRASDFLRLDDFPQRRLNPSGPAFALVVQPSNQPYDSVSLIWEHEADGRWRITSMAGSIT